MPQPGQRTITFSGKILKKLEEISNIFVGVSNDKAYNDHLNK